MPFREPIEAEDTTPVYAEAALGFRAWRVLKDGLGPANKGRPLWRPGVNYAYCPRHSSVNQHCECGLYAFHDLADAEAVSAGLPGLSVIGTVAARGKLQVHHDGFRADEAVITALSLPPGVSSKSSRAQAEQLAQRYQVPLIPADELVVTGQRYASPVPERERPNRDQALKRANRGTNFILNTLGIAMLVVFDLIIALAVYYHPYFLWPLLIPAGFYTLGTIFNGLAHTPAKAWIRKQRRKRWYQRGIYWSSASSLPVFFIALAFASGPSPKTPAKVSAARIAVFNHRVIAAKETTGSWPSLITIPGYQQLTQTVRPGLVGISQGRCLTLVWKSKQLAQQQLCLPATSTTFPTKTIKPSRTVL